MKVYIIILTIILTMNVITVHAQDKSNTEKAGDIIQILIPATAYATTFLLDDSKGRNQFYKSFFTNLGVTYALKYAVNKPRQENNGDLSFPSGHTSASFQGATFIYRRYGFKYSIPAYIGAAFVGWSRVEGESDKHDFTDVAAGALVGVLSSYCFTSPYENMVITPIADSKNVGIYLSYKW
jgi:membrane-associated phospholipid phosphatase